MRRQDEPPSGSEAPRARHVALMPCDLSQRRILEPSAKGLAAACLPSWILHVFLLTTEEAH